MERHSAMLRRMLGACKLEEQQIFRVDHVQVRKPT